MRKNETVLEILTKALRNPDRTAKKEVYQFVRSSVRFCSKMEKLLEIKPDCGVDA